MGPLTTGRIDGLSKTAAKSDLNVKFASVGTSSYLKLQLWRGNRKETIEPKNFHQFKDVQCTQDDGVQSLLNFLWEDKDKRPLHRVFPNLEVPESLGTTP